MPTVKKKRKKKSKIYFGTPVHDAIVAYNRSEDYTFRHKIYTDEIHPAFLKLAENIINTFKFSYFDYGFRDLQEDIRYHFGMYSEETFEATSSLPSEEHSPEEVDHLRSVVAVCTANARSTNRFLESRDSGLNLPVLGTRRDFSGSQERAAASSSASSSLQTQPGAQYQ